MNAIAMRWLSGVCGVTFVLAAGGARAQVLGNAAGPLGVLTLSASASVEVPKDWLSITFTNVREGADASSVQTELKRALDTALSEARKIAKPHEVEVRTGNFSLNPRYSSKGPSGWQGTAELVVEGRDMSAIAQLAGRINTMTIGRVAYGLSREQREKVESDVSAQAIARYRAKAAELARHFGYANYVIREVNVSSAEAGVPVRMFAMERATASAMAAEPLPVEVGKQSVTVTVNGSVQMAR